MRLYIFKSESKDLRAFAGDSAGSKHVRVDRQTKSSYETAELAHSAGAAIKTRYPVVQVRVFDAEERTTTVIQTSDAE